MQDKMSVGPRLPPGAIILLRTTGTSFGRNSPNRGNDEVALYVKGAEKEETQIVMLTVLDGCLRLLHPICPFVTETLFQELHGKDARLVTDDWNMVYAETDAGNAGASQRMQRVMDMVNAIRSIRGEMNVSPSKKVEAHIAVSDAVRSELEPQQRVLMSLAKLESLTWLAMDAEVEQAAVAKVRDDLAEGESKLAELEGARKKLQTL